jgi:hypothetical protein
VDSCTLEYGTNRTTGDNTGTSGCRTKKYDTGRSFTLHWVRDGACGAWNAEEVLLGFFYTLGDSGWNFFSLAVTDTDQTVSVTDNNESGERETTSTLNHLRNAVDSNNALEEWAFGLFAVATLATWATLAASATLLTLGSFNLNGCGCCGLSFS